MGDLYGTIQALVGTNKNKRSNTAYLLFRRDRGRRDRLHHDCGRRDRLHHDRGRRDRLSVRPRSAGARPRNEGARHRGLHGALPPQLPTPHQNLAEVSALLPLHGAHVHL